MVRRALIFALGLSMAGLGLVPLSACGIFTSRLGECATPETQARCDQMNAEEGTTQLAAAPDASCCSLSNAPVPAVQKASEFSAAASLVVVLEISQELPRSVEQRPTQLEQAFSPPGLQSFLCTFLI